MSPGALRTPAVWRGEEIFGRDDWEVNLDSPAIAELARVVRSSSGLALDAQVPRQLELPLLAPRLTRLQDRLETGSGATILRGLPLEAFDSERDVERAFWALARYVGTPLSQTSAGQRLLHVRDEHFGSDDPRVRGPHTSKRLGFHTDRCDVIAFLCVTPALSGGVTHLLSSAALHNEMLRRHPRALAVLREPFPYLRHTVDGGNEHAFVEMPVFSEHEGHFAASYLRVLIDRAHRSGDAPDLSPEQIAALDTLEAVAEDPDLYASINLAPGEMLFLNNWVTFHRRTAFEDHDDPERRRHLLRLWLSVPNSRPLDPRLAQHFGSTEAGAIRGGIWGAKRPRN